jgi:hypothetical protein
MVRQFIVQPRCPTSVEFPAVADEDTGQRAPAPGSRFFSGHENPAPACDITTHTSLTGPLPIVRQTGQNVAGINNRKRRNSGLQTFVRLRYTRWTSLLQPSVKGATSIKQPIMTPVDNGCGHDPLGDTWRPPLYFGPTSTVADEARPTYRPGAARSATARERSRQPRRGCPARPCRSPRLRATHIQRRARPQQTGQVLATPSDLARSRIGRAQPVNATLSVGRRESR